MRILVVCGAGASSTFVAQRLRRAAESAGRDWQASAGTESTVANSTADLVLVGPHLEGRADAIRAAASCPVAVLPEDVFDDRDGLRTLALVDTTLSSPPLPASKGTS